MNTKLKSIPKFRNEARIAEKEDIDDAWVMFRDEANAS
jgi:hypothetical protein